MNLTTISNVDTFGFSAYWRIENFKPGYSLSLKSPTFLVKMSKAKWHIEIEEKDGRLGVYLSKDSNPIRFPIIFNLFFLTGSGWTAITKNAKFIFIAGGQSYGMELNLKELKEKEWFYFPNGSLTVYFRMWNNTIKEESSQCLMISRLGDGNNLLHRPIENFSTLLPRDLFSFPLSYEFPLVTSSSIEDEKAKAVDSKHTQTDTDTSFCNKDELLQLFKEKDFTFVTLRTPDKDVLVHKAVLCMKSPVFNAMFERQMREGYSNVVDLDDIDSETISPFIKYLHFEPLGDFDWNVAVKLYYAADKYQINTLKKECVSILKKEFCVENICHIFILADWHQDKELMNYAKDYFYQNSKDIFKSNQWKQFLHRTDLVAEILCSMADKM